MYAAEQFLCLAANTRQGSKQGGNLDTLSFRDTMQQPDRECFVTVMDEEIKTQEERKHRDDPSLVQPHCRSDLVRIVVVHLESMVRVYPIPLDE